MLDNETLTRKVAAFKKESRKDFDKAVAALIALAFLHKDMGLISFGTKTRPSTRRRTASAGNSPTP